MVVRHRAVGDTVRSATQRASPQPGPAGDAPSPSGPALSPRWRRDPLSHRPATLLDPPTTTDLTDHQEDITIRTDGHDGSSGTQEPPVPGPAEIVELLEAHLADLNTHLAMNTMALAAFGIATPPLGWPEDPGVGG